jgi:hypothetical protein
MKSKMKADHTNVRPCKHTINLIEKEGTELNLIVVKLSVSSYFHLF